MKTETNLYLRSLVGEKKSALCGYHEEELHRLNDALTALRTEETQKQPCSTVPPLSEKTVEVIRQLLKISLDCTREMSDRVKKITPLLPFGEAQDNLILAAKGKEDKLTTALNEFTAAYPEKPKSK